jgi:hypothetical protein
MSLVWIFVTLPGNYFFWLNIGNAIIGAFLLALVGTAGLPSEMRIFPQSRFGQFCSAQAMLRSTFTVFAGVLAGAFMDLVKYLCNGSDYSYRFIFVWMVVFGLISTIFLIKVYIEWHRLGALPPAGALESQRD